MKPEMEKKKVMMSRKLKVGQEIHRKERMGDEIRRGNPRSSGMATNMLNLRK